MANDNDKKSIDLTLTPDDQPEAAPAPQKEVEDLTDKDLDTTGVEIHTDESSAEVTAVEADYGAEQIQILEGLEAVRMRPGMYIGSTSERGLHHLVYEVVDNSIDEALAGYCDHIDVTIHKDNSITVVDNGRGIPVDMHESGKPAVEVVLTVLHAGGKFGGDGYKVSGGLHGVGVSVVNALSTSMEVQVKRDGKIYEIAFERGVTTKPLTVVGTTTETGTRVHFVPDPEIFSVTTYSYETLRHRLRELSFLNHGITIGLHDERVEPVRSEQFHFDGGISSFVEHLNRKKEVLNPEPIYFNGVKDDTVVEIAMQYNDSYQENIYSFVNNINTEEGGTHLAGFKLALTRAANDFARKQGILKDKDSNLSGDDVREGLTCVISLKIREGATVRGPDEDEARQLRSPRHRRLHRHGRPLRVLRRESGHHEAHHRQGHHGRPRPRSRPQGPRAHAPQERPRGVEPAGQARRLLRQGPGAGRDLPRRG